MNLKEVKLSALRSLRPPQRLPLSLWAEKHLRLPPGVSADPGRFRMWKPQREIADCISDPTIERVTVLKSVRVGYSSLLTAAIASFGINEPCPMLLYLPTDDDARDYVVSDMEPIFEASPGIGDVFSPDLDESGRSTITQRRFPGGYIKILAAKAPRNFRRHNARIVMIDEEDGMEPTKEGDPVKLAERRTLSFANRKIIRGSTPTDADTSTIYVAYKESDCRIFEVACPECETRHQILWEDIRWPPNEPHKAAWRCPSCEELISERYKASMVEAGEWRVTNPLAQSHAGFHLNALVSLLPNASWGTLAQEFVNGHDDPEALRVFRNLLLAEPWNESGQSLDEDALFARRENFGLDAEWVDTDGEIHKLTIPGEVLLITVGVDVQDDRLEATVTGFAEGSRAYILGHFVLHGSPEDDALWRELDELLLTKWDHPLGGRIGVDASIIDSGDGGWTDDVYAFCWSRARRMVLAGKGMQGFGRPAVEMSKGKVGRGSIAGRGRLWIVGVDAIKAQLLTRATRDPDMLRFSRTLPRIWFEQFSSERRIIRRVGGKPVRKFERIGSRAAEALDATVYSFAARAALPPTNFAQRRLNLIGHVKSTRPTWRDIGSQLNARTP